MARRFDLGRALLLAGGALLLISLFLEWYDTGPTGWEVFEALDLVLALLAAAAVALALWPEGAPPWSAGAVPGGALLVVIVQLVNAPPAAGDGRPSTGAWLALAAGLLMAAGAALSLARISVTVQVAERERRRRVSAVDRRGGRTGDRVGPRATPAATASPTGSRDIDIERTQPLSALPESDAEDAERP
jgi:peptidoglycan/LPS O-acetylase OafA/YrhL